MTTPRPHEGHPVSAGSRSPHAGQRFGRITSRRSGSEFNGHPGTYLVRDDETGTTYSFGYPDIVTEGLRTIRTGERVRFLIDQAHPGHASYIIRLDLPDIAEYYK